MKTFLLFLLATAAFTQTNSIQIIDSQSPPHTMTIVAPANFGADVICTLGTTNFGACAASAATAAGVNTSVQFNSSGILAGDSIFTYNNAVLNIIDSAGTGGGSGIKLNRKLPSYGSFEQEYAIGPTAGTSSLWLGSLTATGSYQFHTAMYAGTRASPMAVPSGNNGLYFDSSGYNGSGVKVGAYFTAVFPSNWSPTNQEMYWDFQATALNGTSTTDSLRIGGDKNISYVPLWANSDLVATGPLKFYYGGSMQWFEKSTVTNALAWYDASSTSRMRLDASGALGVAGTGVALYTPTVVAQSTNAASIPMYVVGYPSQSADLLQVWSAVSGTDYFHISSAGVITVSSLAGGGTQCIQVNNSGVLSGVSCGAGSYTGASPISITGSVVSCPTCLTTAGGQTISASDTFSGGIVTGATSTVGGDVHFDVGGTRSIGTPSVQANFMYAAVMQSPKFQIQDFTFTSSFWYLNASIGTGVKEVTMYDESSNPVWTWETQFSGISFRQATSYLNIVPSASNTYSLGTTGTAWSGVYTQNLRITSVASGTQCLQANSSGDISGAGIGCGGTTYTGGTNITVSGGVIACPFCLTTAGGQTISSRDTFNSGVTVGGDILASGTPSIGSSSNYFNYGYFGATVVASQLRVEQGTPASPGDYFYWINPFLHTLFFYNSSGTVLQSIDDTHFSGGNTHSYYNGDVAPSSVNSFDLGLSSYPWRNVYADSGYYMGGVAAIDSGRNGHFVTLDTGGAATFGGGATSTTAGFGATGFATYAGGWYYGLASQTLNVTSSGLTACTITIRGGIVVASTC